jgi:hypothetical protein
MEETPRQMRLGTAVRGTIIGVLLVGYGLLFGRDGASFTECLLVAAGLQFLVLLLRKLVPPAMLPQAMYAFELLVDGVTVLMFALGVYGGILRAGMEV